MKQKNKRRTYKKRGGGIKQFGTKCDKSYLFEDCTFLEQVGQPIELLDSNRNILCKAVKLNIMPIEDGKYIDIQPKGIYPTVTLVDENPNLHVYAFYDYQVSDLRRNATAAYRAVTALPLWLSGRAINRKDCFIFIEKVLRLVTANHQNTYWGENNNMDDDSSDDDDDIRKYSVDFFNIRNGFFIIAKGEKIVYNRINLFKCFIDIEERINYIKSKLFPPAKSNSWVRWEDGTLLNVERFTSPGMNLDENFLTLFSTQAEPTQAEQTRRSDLEIETTESPQEPVELQDQLAPTSMPPPPSPSPPPQPRGGRRSKKTRRKTRR